MRLRSYGLNERLVQVMGVVGALLIAGGCHQAQPHPKGVATLAVLGSIDATVAPCGCTSRPLGGLDRVAQRIADAQKAQPTLTLVVGNTFFASMDSPPSMQGHARATAQLVANVLAGVGELRLAPGPFDHGAQASALKEAPQILRKQLDARAAPGVRLTQEVVRVGDIQVGLLTPEGQADQPQWAEEMTRAASLLRQAGAEVVVVLWPWEVNTARSQLQSLGEGVDIVIAGNSARQNPPAALGQATLIDAGARGEWVGLITLRRGEGGPWRFFDGGKQAIDDATARLERLEREAAQLPPGPGQDARLKRARTLREDMAALKQSRPTGATLAFEAVAMDTELPRAPWATQALEHYNNQLCKIAEADTAKRQCAPAPNPSAQYVGSLACQSCHPEAWSVWQKTQHAHAWATLTTAHKACDLTCVGCHVVGFEKPGGFCRLADASKWANVGCEMCHGPGAGHVQNPYDKSFWAENFIRDTPEATCRGCHNPTHSDQFDFAVYRPKVLGPGHGLPSKRQR